MAFFARNVYTATAGQTVFAITFPFLDSSHVVADVDGVAAPLTVTSTTSITLDTGAALGTTVTIQRVTPHTALVAFTGGVPVTQENMETQRKQFTYIHEEVEDDITALSASAQTFPVARVLYTGMLVGSSGVLTDAANRYTFTGGGAAFLELLRNSPSQISSPGTGTIRLESGVWEIQASMIFRRNAGASGSTSIEWDIVDTTNTTLLKMTDISLSMGPVPAAGDDVMLHSSGRAFIDINAATDYELHARVSAGTGVIDSHNAHVTYTRLGN